MRNSLSASKGESSQSDARVLVLAGPTASGKTELAIELALEFDAEIVGADSRQIYRDMTVGTAAPTPSQRGRVPHHLIAFLDPYERYSAARFCADARRVLEEIRARGKRAIVTGGTGFYIRALTGGVTLAPELDPGLRGRLAKEAQIHDAEFLHRWLSVRHAARADKIHPDDRYRVLRGLEVALAGDGERECARPRPSIGAQEIAYVKVYVEIEDELLQQRIESRADAMLASGFLEEAERVGSEAVAASAVGYPQALAFLRGWSTSRELRGAIVRATRRYAKRQATWFRTEPQTTWLARRDVPARIRSLAREKLGWA